MTYHQPVLLNESVNGLNIKPKGTYADLTFGGGGHSREILARLGKSGRLLAFDQDSEARTNVPDDRRLTFVHANFRFLKNFLNYYRIDKLDGVLADLGVSSHQIDREHRGFTFRSNAPLDMRMNPDSETTAEKVLNSCSLEEMTRIFREYGEISGAHRFASKIVEARSKGRISDTHALLEVLKELIPAHHASKTLAKLYQAIRIEVNGEMEALRELLEQSRDVLNEGGRLVVLSYHSLEDRLVKNMIRAGNLEGIIEKDFFGHSQMIFKAINQKVITPSDEEIWINPRARSAKLRIAERI